MTYKVSAVHRGPGDSSPVLRIENKGVGGRTLDLVLNPELIKCVQGYGKFRGLEGPSNVLVLIGETVYDFTSDDDKVVADVWTMLVRPWSRG